MKIQEIKEQFGNCPTERLPELIEAYKEDERSGIKAEIAKAEKRLEALEKEKARMFTMLPVSYTHLDVYKRQGNRGSKIF